MTNSDLLKQVIDESGLKIGHIASFVGISRQLLWKKVNNPTPSNQYEIDKMCEVLKITSLRQKESIFFAKV